MGFAGPEVVIPFAFMFRVGGTDFMALDAVPIEATVSCPDDVAMGRVR